jgi:hypothetical protein
MADARKLNAAEKHIADVGHCRWAFPRAHYYWFVGGTTTDPKVQSRMRYRLTRDMTTLLSSCRRKNIQPVALLSDTEVDVMLAKLIRAMPGWKTVVFGPQGFNLPNTTSICAETADLILCYGDPSEALTTILESVEHPPELMRRNMMSPGRQRQPLTHSKNPNSQYWSDVDRLRHWRPSPTRGLQIREQIDMRPKFKV